ncbi:hypothetical protein A2U01_0087490, partial [Trifolium medium]|nr:hypothetical protein [Trifolium medium]
TQWDSPTQERVTQIVEPEDMLVYSNEPINGHPGNNPYSPSNGSASGKRPSAGAKVHPSKRTKSCPPGVTRSVVSGPWSLEWLHD